ncbi:hypothetical protein PENANT_c011G02128 [Penicillium antarcticum]|uniref:Peptidase A1 domain-containing protein n=1 Tax=Penicillium antarcticum TaxID=416450 RepID=A0A1V6Q6U2_9EURO|nr:hypothetical protein PENANT_c011G02128 [Penicillium antarcticum]
MRLNGILAMLGIAATTSAIGLHKAVNGLLQVTPSFAGDDIALHPALSPNHDSHDLENLVAGLDKVLHYSQEGHRPALHGAKHASLEAKFVRNTVILDQSDHVKSVACDDSDMQICFDNPIAMATVEASWLIQGGINLVTYHAGCGDESSGKRSIFHASQPLINLVDMCIVVSVAPIQESDALESGVMTWGTYNDPKKRKRSPTKGHVRVTKPTQPQNRGRPDSPAARNVTDQYASNATMDITLNPWAMETFFNNSHLDTTHMGEKIDTMDFMDMDDPEVPPAHANMTRRSSTRRRADRTKRTMTEISKRASSELSRRDIFTDLWNGLRDLGRRIGAFFVSAAAFIKKVGDHIVELAVITVKLAGVVFGVPFDHTYHNDIKINQYLKSEIGNRPPAIFGMKDGYTLASSDNYNNPEAFHWTVQCAKCGVHVNIDIDGRLAFSIKDGITEGSISFVNNDPLTLDAQFGISADGTVSKSKDKKKTIKPQKSKDLKTIPFGGLIIPGILTLGPQVTFGVAVSLETEGKVELLVGGSVSIGAGHAIASLKGKNEIKGFQPSFDPVFRAKGEFSLTGDVGLPVALEVGLTVLEGKFKETVGLVNTPSVYVKATANLELQARGESTCKNGVQLKVGAKNRIHVAGFNIFEYELVNIPLFEKDLGCVNDNGFNVATEKPADGLIKKVTDETGDSGAGKPYISDATREYKKIEGTQGFKIIMAADSGTIMVSGTNGGLFMVDKNDGYDVSAPWGTLDTKENPLTLDVFGRVLAYKLLKSSDKKDIFGMNAPIVADLMVSEPQSVPVGYRSTAMKQLESSQSQKTYGIPMVFEGAYAKYTFIKPMYYPTVCITPFGAMLIATREIITKEGKVQSAWNPNKDFTKEMDRELFAHFGVYRKECNTVQLIASN